MKKMSYLFVLAVLLTACGGDKQTELKSLEAERDELTAKIEDLKAELAYSENSKKEIDTWVSLEKIEPGHFSHLIKVQGTIQSDNNILVPAQASGIVKSIKVTEGQKVKRGTLLAELDGAIYERTIAELETNLELATTIFERQERLWKKHIGSEVQFLQAKTNKEGLQNKLETVKEQYRLTKISAPISGEVDQILIKEGEAAAAGFGTIRIVKMSDLKITAKLSEKYIEKIKIDDTVQVRVPNNNLAFSSTVKAVSQVIDHKNRTFPVEIMVPADQQNLKPNMLVELTINDYSNQHAFIVPLNIIQKTGDQEFLFTARPSDTDDIWLVSKRFVKSGLYQDNQVEIISGLEKNESIVVFGFQDLADGQRVKLSSNITSKSNN